MMWGLWHWLERRADLSGGRAALIDGPRVLDYRTLHDRVAGLAAGLRERGLRRGDRMAVLSINRTEYVELLFAAARVGAIVVPLNWRLTAAELAYQVGDSEPVLLIVDPELGDLAAGLLKRPETTVPRGVISLAEGSGPDHYETLVATTPGTPEGRPDDPFLILYTSGTTGRPKGAVLTQATQFWNSVNIRTAANLTEHDVTLNVLPMFHAGGIGLFTLPTLHAGGTAVLQRRFDPAGALRLIATHGVTAMFGVPSLYLMLLGEESLAWADLTRIRFSCGGSPCPLTIIEAFRDRGVLFQFGYGLTETAPTCTLIPAADAFRKMGSAGKAAIHVELRVVNQEGDDAAPGEIGEVWTRGPNLFSGYWRRPEETAEVFVRPDDLPGGVGYAGWWFRTGDLATRDAEGFLYVVDRKKDMIISGGENIYPAEVEDVLFRHPAIAEAAVLGVPDPRWGEVPIAAVVLRPGRALTLEELSRFCDGTLARYKIPRRLAVVETLPRNAAGKVLKRVLRDQLAHPEAS